MSMVLAALAKGAFSFVLMAVLAAVCAGVIRLIVLVLARGRTRTPVVAPEMTMTAKPIRDDSAVIAAVIAAAAHMTGAPQRIVFLAEQKRSAHWITEVRSRHHGGHSPHR
ncbi:hypothetical protein [Rhodoplanes roseus]|uniref:Uncharacterized protein n=1 Tax=Rhodoplanes roseus TaxID=29409 RepID=A0A327L5V7_9BRAD|nr:hypothetical protein [Rhodoplanes roseus]RAI43008.1 hypothetical protein CH341_16545 [Rhodoplanes roseus]